ncbi:MAG: LacI family transcriptional regulator [Cellulomonadaceae bacterium]|nr:LacI family transcriptional regulator [Cellulomonadaceae bacterium]
MTIAAEFSAVGGYDAARRLLTSTDATAVFVCSDSQSQGVVAAARDLGRVVPRDVAVIGFDGTSQTQFSEPRLSVVAQPLPEMARAALAALSDPEQAPPTVPFELVIRSSCGC